MMQIETGDHQSASWQFTIELSDLWQKNFPDLDISFSPSYTSEIAERFENLLSKNARLVIAPLSMSANQTMLSFPIRLVTVLWEVYVVPIDIGNKNEPISLNNYRNWYISEKSVVIPELMRALNKSFFAETIRAEYEYKMSVIKTPETRTGTDITDKRQFNDDSIDTELNIEPTQPILKPFENDQADNSQIFQKLAQIAGLKDFDTEVLRIDNDMIQEVVSEYRDGILFYEMMGSILSLKEALESKLTTTSFKRNVQDFLVSVHPWIQPMYKRRARLKTLGFNMALFVHADEDPEFVKNIIKVLAKRPKSYFPTSFILRNLSIQKTKEILPIYLHAGSLKYFGLD
ncbi:MAG: hypothetical protein HN580_18330 [Deltaproteobacteria bacterium]|nr:hypothetical protein [Deltaproteobacteria bacterium]MBT4091122.1 hypothetical protein [Deltaproteobacteria bacterium]MBT4268135.1 hypothetical protein [Deltaproteobacteria bacterium]MBT4640236.1 hypothetical protein [Deltaproteobacteria bacterium]MBT6502022.1 hypothetical protein [Deltaproteobacteria bacterium]